MPSGAEDIVTGFNELRSSVVLLQELKHMLQTAEYELESLRTRYNTLTGKVCGTMIVLFNKLVHIWPQVKIYIGYITGINMQREIGRA